MQHMKEKSTKMEAEVTNSNIFPTSDELKRKAEEDKRHKLKAGLFIMGATTISAIVGGMWTMRIIKKRDHIFLDEAPPEAVQERPSQVISKTYELNEKGATEMIKRGVHAFEQDANIHIPPPAKLESGTVLALKALGWGTLLAVSGCSLLFYGIWKLSGATTLQEFPIKMGAMFPKLPKNDKGGRTEFKDFNELITYLSNTSGSDSQTEKSQDS